LIHFYYTVDASYTIKLNAYRHCYDNICYADLNSYLVINK